ncbi:hypothetical protein GWI33_018448 [Rhynchophorus ferrugineus]|uniref:RRM domain-containing protein n=1 Tax=Rhynchophorus ferrugineus TaxID=354439 RepID=A0A834M820_RHYFE|nr:hypothetical protein GWI33_018448 [Rhynchophorus ferrugineus]
MEYSVGSIAELISGVKAANKTKVLKKKIKRNTTPVLKEYCESTEDTDITSSKNELKKKSLKRTFSETKSVDDDKLPAKKQKKDKKVIAETKFRENISDAKLDNQVESDSRTSKPKHKKLGKNEQNAINRIKNKHNKEVKTSSNYVDRTIFVGNIPIATKKQHIKRYFRKFGEIESVRFRGIPVADLKTPKKVAAIKKQFHPDRNTLHAYIRFANSEDCKKAEAANGCLFKDHHIRVQCCEVAKKYDESKAIFIGNLSFEAEEEELWTLFSSCGPISDVRIVRDGRTGMGKGFAYVNFKDSDAVQLALEMETVSLKNRELRISLCNVAKGKKKKNIKIKKPNVRTVKKDGFNKKSEVTNSEKSPVEETKEDRTAPPKKEKSFSGSKFTDKKVKKKFNKGAKDKKKLAEKLTAPSLKKQPKKV